MADKMKTKAKAKPAEAKEQPSKGRIRAVTPAGWPPVIGLTVDEAAAALRTDDKTIRKLIQDGAIPARIVGRGYRLDPGALRAWVASGEDGRKPAPKQPTQAELDAELDAINAENAEIAMDSMADPAMRRWYATGEIPPGPGHENDPPVFDTSKPEPYGP